MCIFFPLPGLRHFFGPYVRSVSLSPSVLVSSVTKIWNDRLKVSNNRQLNYNSITTQADISFSSVSKESTCNAGDPSSIPGLGRSTEEGIGAHSSIVGHALWLSW